MRVFQNNRAHDKLLKIEKIGKKVGMALLLGQSGQK